MPSEWPKGDPHRTKTCVCGAVVDVWDGSHPIEACGTARALLSDEEWTALHRFANYQVAEADAGIHDEDQPDFETTWLVHFEDAHGTRVHDPFTDETGANEVNPVTYYGEHFIHSPFIPVARYLAEALNDAYTDGLRHGKAEADAAY